MFKQLIAASSLCFATSQALADETLATIFLPFGTELGLIEHSTLSVSDQVDGKCWTNSSSIRSKVFLILEQNDIAVPNFDPAFFNFRTVSTTLSAFGYRTVDGMCVVSARYDVSTRVSNTLGGFEGKQKFSTKYLATVFERSSVFSSPNNSNAQLSDFMEGAASEFAGKVLSARRAPKSRNTL